MQKKQSQIPVKKGKNIFTIQRRTTYPVTLDLKIITKIEQNIPTRYKPSDDFILAFISIYTEKRVYQGVMSGKCIAKQLSWNLQSLQTITQCLMGIRQKVQIRFYPISSKHPQQSTYNHNNNNNTREMNKYKIKRQKQKIIQLQPYQPPIDTKENYFFQIVCQISSGINLTLFQVQMIRLPVQNSHLHMIRKVASLQRVNKQKQSKYTETQDQYKGRLNQIQAIQKQIKSSSIIEINVMKSNFIKIANKCKQQIRKVIGSIPTINPINGLIQNRTKQSTARIGMKNIAEEDRQQEEEDDRYQKNNRNNRNPYKNNQQVEEQRTISNKKTKQINRRIKKVDRQIYDSVSYPKMEVQVQEDENIKRQHRYQQLNNKNNNNGGEQQHKQPSHFESIRMGKRQKYSQQNDSSEDQNEEYGISIMQQNDYINKNGQMNKNGQKSYFQDSDKQQKKTFLQLQMQSLNNNNNKDGEKQQKKTGSSNAQWDQLFN